MTSGGQCTRARRAAHPAAAAEARASWLRGPWGERHSFEPMGAGAFAELMNLIHASALPRRCAVSKVGLVGSNTGSLHGKVVVMLKSFGTVPPLEEREAQARSLADEAEEHI